MRYARKAGTAVVEAAAVRCFAPVCGPDARVLILGSMPGAASLRAGQYYAHPRNLFWPVMEAVLGIPAAMPYVERCACLVAHRIAVWDVLQACVRPGSLDAAIVEDSVVPNNLRRFLRLHLGIRAIYFNGARAEQAYRKYACPGLPKAARNIPLRRLPSTSPANASIGLDDKVRRWRAIAE